VTAREPAQPRLLAHTVEIDDPGPLTSFLPPADAHAWVQHGDGMVGWGEVVRHKAVSITDAEEWWSDLCATVEHECALESPPAGAGMMAFGSFVFDPDNTSAQSVLIVPETILGRRHGRCWLTRIGTSVPAGAALEPTAPPQPPRGIAYADGGLSSPAWEATVAEVVRRIGADGLDKVVLARDLIATATSDIDPRWLVSVLAEDYALCWTYLVDGLVGATPEMLVRREHGRVTSRVLAGTIWGSGDETHDRRLRLAPTLAHSSKDREEHDYAVRSVARALSPYCSELQVPEAPYVLELPNVLHLATDVTARAEPGTSSLALAAALHPSAAVCGTPTLLARETISELEHLDRERYAGPVGWLDANGDGEWGIALRCGQISETDPREIRLFAGCGIVAGSDPAAELAESNAKLVPMRDALGG
jgi:menaquinone-specific isochorismate synthase